MTELKRATITVWEELDVDCPHCNHTQDVHWTPGAPAFGECKMDCEDCGQSFMAVRENDD